MLNGAMFCPMPLLGTVAYLGLSMVYTQGIMRTTLFNYTSSGTSQITQVYHTLVHWDTLQQRVAEWMASPGMSQDVPCS